MSSATAVASTNKRPLCKTGDGKPIFTVKSGLCSACYQRDRRGQELTTPIREYGEGHNRVSGSINDKRYAAFKKYAEKHHDGSEYKAVQEIISLFVDGL